MFKHLQGSTQKNCVSARQRGSALIVALVFLLAMTLIGTTAMQGTTQQERMAGNYLDRMMAFQAAEAALAVARRSAVATPPSPSAISPTTPFSAQTTTWWETPVLPCQPMLPCSLPGYQDLAAPPRYVIQNRGFLSGGGGSAAVNPGGGGTKCQITARANGGTTSAVVILEEIIDC